MNKQILSILLLCTMLVVSGCSSLPSFTSSSNQGAENKNHGEGLNVVFSLDQDFLPSLRYTLELTNDGEKTIEISRQDVELTSTKRTLEGNIPLTSQSIDEFYANIFSSNTLTLGPHEKRVFTGTVTIDPNYYEDVSNEGFDLLLEITYPYSADFSTSVELHPEEFLFRVARADMSGPLQLSSIEGVYRDTSTVDIIYELKPTTSLKSSVTINRYDFKLGTRSLSCQPYKDEESTKVEISTPQVSAQISSLYFVCTADLSEYSSLTTTLTSGSYSYEYVVDKSQRVTFPQSRNNRFS